MTSLQTLSTLLSALPDSRLCTLLRHLVSAGETISELCRNTCPTLASSQNAFGDDQLSIDILADKAMFKSLQESSVVKVASSEETPVERKLNDEGVFAVVFDPLDGSSIIGSNFAVGTIVGIFDLRKGTGKASQSLIGLSAEDMICSIAFVYGPRTTMYIAHSTWQVKELTFLYKTWTVTDSIHQLDSSGKLFAPANLRASQDNAAYSKLITYYHTNKYTLRYTGGMVPDVVQLLVKRRGVFVSPISETAKAKLRLLYEVLPMAYLVTQAGGDASDENGCSKAELLERKIQRLDERTGVCLGSVAEVETFRKTIRQI